MKSASRVRLEKPVEEDQPKERRGRDHGRQQRPCLPNTVPDALTVTCPWCHLPNAAVDGYPPLRYSALRTNRHNPSTSNIRHK